MMTYRQSKKKRNLVLRARIIHLIRQFFMAHDYLEVETPCRIPTPAPEAYIDAEISGPWFLHTSPELCMKRLLASGYDRIFQVCKCFRRKERGRRHLPELTLLEWYSAGQNYLDMMEQCEALIRFLARNLGFGKAILYQGEKIDLTAPWIRMSVFHAFDRFAPISMEDALAQDRYDQVMTRDIEPNLGHEKPLFLYDFPAKRASLARLKSNNPAIAERFELYISSMELCNAFSELTDTAVQIKRFEQEQAVRHQSGKPTYPLPEKFIEALPSMPAAAGSALGLDRLVMLFADTTTIDDVVAFTPEEL